MKPKLLTFCLLATLATFNLYANDPFEALEQQDPTITVVDSATVDIRELIAQKSPLLQAELMKLGFEEVSNLLSVLPQETLHQVLASDGGVVGNGGGIVVDPEGKTELADLYVNLKELNSSGELPHYYQPFDFEEYPGLKAELIKIIDFLNLRHSRNLISDDLSQFHLYKTPILLKQLPYPVVDNLNFQSIAFTYEAVVTNLETFTVQNQRIVEIRPDLFARLPDNRARALLLIHEFLHHGHSNVYDRYSSRYVLISSLIKQLNTLLPVLEQQEKNNDKVLLNDAQMEASRTLQVILARYQGNNNNEIDQFVSKGGGVTNSIVFAQNNYLDLNSKVTLSLLRCADTTICQTYEQEYVDNTFQNTSSLSIQIDPELGDLPLKNSTFRNLHGNLVIRMEGAGHHIEDVKNVDMVVWGNNNSIHNITSENSRHASIRVLNANISNIRFSGSPQVALISNSHIKDTQIIFRNDNIKIDNSVVEDSILRSEIFAHKSIIIHSTIQDIEIANGIIDRSQILQEGRLTTKCQNVSFRNSNLLLLPGNDQIGSVKPVTLENLNLIGHLIFTFSPFIPNVMEFNSELVYVTNLKKDSQVQYSFKIPLTNTEIPLGNTIYIKSSPQRPGNTQEISKNQLCENSFSELIYNVGKMRRASEELITSFEKDLGIFCAQE